MAKSESGEQTKAPKQSGARSGKKGSSGRTTPVLYIFLFGLYHLALALVLGVALIALVTDLNPDEPTELELLLIVMVSGAVGSFVHAATSFASYVGNRKLGSSWLWWYVLRPFIGAGLAVIFYFVVRGGFLQAGSSAADALNLYGLAALGGLSGMFSKQATDKLREVFDNVFKVARDDRENKLKDE